MTLNFYLISTVISLILDTIVARFYCSEKKLEKNGYKFVKKEERKLNILLFALDKFHCFIPIVNIVTNIFFTLGCIIDKLDEKFCLFFYRKHDLAETYFWCKTWAWEKQGKIYDVAESEFIMSVYKCMSTAASQKQNDKKTLSKRKEETAVHNETIAIEKAYERISNKGETPTHNESVMVEKTYDEMSNEEKLAFLQAEKEKIMKSINSISGSPSDVEETPTSNNSINETYKFKK